MCFSSPSIPQPSPALIQASNMQTMMGVYNTHVQMDQYNYFRDRQDNFLDPLTKRVVDEQLELSRIGREQGDDWYNYQKEVFRPVEQSLVAQAMETSVPEYYERYAQQAMAQAATQQANAADQMNRALAGMGINPNSGAYIANARGLQAQNAAQLGAVTNEARDRAEALSWMRRAEVAGLGKGLVGAGNASYNVAMGAGQAAYGAGADSSRVAADTMGTPQQYGALANQYFGNAGDILSNIYGAQTQAWTKLLDKPNPLMEVLGQGAGSFASSYGSSLGNSLGSSGGNVATVM